MMAPSNTVAIKRLIDEILLLRPPKKAEHFLDEVQRECEERSIAFEGVAAVEYWWSLARTGVVAIYPRDPHVRLEFPSLVVTDRGRRLLERGETSPHDPPKYLDAVRRRVEVPDEIALTYLNEAVGAWGAGLYRASAVMLGCACERLVLILADEIAQADLAPWSDRIGRKRATMRAGISEVFELVRKCLTDLGDGKKLPPQLGDALDRKLSAIFDHARALRNESGHCTGTAVSVDEAEAGLLLFPGFYPLWTTSAYTSGLTPATAVKISPEGDHALAWRVAGRRAARSMLSQQRESTASGARPPRRTKRKLRR